MGNISVEGGTLEEKFSKGGAVFDPISLQVVYVNKTEAQELIGNVDSTKLVVKGLGIDCDVYPKPVLIDAETLDVICIGGDSDELKNSYSAAVARRLLKEGISGDLDKLSGFRIVVTDKCNMKCSYCFVDTNTGAKDITLDEIKNGFELLISARSNNNEITYQWFGGEPLIKKKLIIEADQIARDMAHKVGATTRPTVVTNGTVLNDALLNHFLEFKYGVGISLDGPPEVNMMERRLLSGKVTEPIIEQNIHELLNAGIHVGINVTPTVNNCFEIIETIEYVLSLGVRFIYINSPIPINGYWLKDGVNWAKALHKARLFALSKGAMVFSHFDRVLQSLDSQTPRVFEHIQGCGGLNAALLPGGRLSVLDLNWRNSDYIFDVSQVKLDSTLLSKAQKELHPIKRCETCIASAICGGTSINDQLLLESSMPLKQYCDFFETATKLAVFDSTTLQ